MVTRLLVSINDFFDRVGAAIERADDRLNQKSEQQQFLRRSIVVGLFIFGLCLMSGCGDATAPNSPTALANKTCVLTVTQDTSVDDLFPNVILLSTVAPRPLGLDSVWAMMPQAYPRYGDAYLGRCDQPFYAGVGQYYFWASVYSLADKQSALDITDDYGFGSTARTIAGDTVAISSVVTIDPVANVIFSARADTIRGQNYINGTNYARTAQVLTQLGRVHAALQVDKGKNLVTSVAMLVTRALRYAGDGSFSAGALNSGFDAFVTDAHSATPQRIMHIQAPKLNYTFQMYDNASLARAAALNRHLKLIEPIGQ